MANVHHVVVTAPDGRQVRMTPEQAETLNMLEAAQAGGCAAVHGYVPTSGYVESPVLDLQLLTRFSNERLLKRRIRDLENLTYADVEQGTIPSNKLKGKTEAEWFESRKERELNSMHKTLDGVRDDARRMGHDRCYTQFAPGVKVHFVTEKGEDGLMHPVLTNGLPTAQNIMVSYLELSRKVVQEGIRKQVNSGACVLMGKVIAKALNKRSVEVRMLSLKEGNFDHLSISGNVIIPENVRGLMD